MLDVSAAYTAAIKDKNRTDRITGTIKLCDGETINITDDIIVNNSVTLKEQLVSGDTFEIGTFYTNQLDITVYDDNFLSRTYANARITPKYEIQLADGTWESVPLGVFTVDNSLTKRKGSIHKLTAFDDSTKFDVDISAYSGGKKTVQQHIKDIAADVGITLATTDFSSYPNYDLAVDSAASTAIQTYRDLVEWCCALMSASARINRYGKLEIVKLKEKTKTVDGTLVYDADYTVEGYERTGTEFFDLRALTKYFSTTFDGEQYVYKNRAVITASDTAARNATMFIPENPLLQSVSDRKAAFEACADEINIALRRVEFSFNGNPAIECFDTLCGNGGKIDVNRTIAFFPTSLVWKYRGAHKVSCAFAELTDEATASVSEVATFAAAVANKSPLSTKSKTDKRIDDVSKRANGVGKFTNADKTSEIFNDYNHNTAYGNYSHVEGYKNRMDSEGAIHSWATHIEGAQNTEASRTSCPSDKKASYNHIEGRQNNCWGRLNHVEGVNCFAEYDTQCCHVEGSNSRVSEGARVAHVEGKDCVAGNECSHAEGKSAQATGYASHAEGGACTASGYYSHAEGYGNEASGNRSHAEGELNIASGNHSHAEGWLNIASGECSHVAGKDNTASGDYSIASGAGSETTGAYAIAHGYCCTAGDNSVAIGTYVQATNGCIAFGKYNKTTDALFVVGCGTSTSDGKIKAADALVIDYDGNLHIPGKVTADGGVEEIASSTKAGIVKISRDFEISEDGTLTIVKGGTFPLATKTTPGGVIVGHGFSVDDNGFLTLLLSDSLTINNWDQLDIHGASSQTAGIVKIGSGITAEYQRNEDTGMLITKISVQPATTQKAGIVKVGEGLSVEADGTLNADIYPPASLFLSGASKMMLHKYIPVESKKQGYYYGSATSDIICDTVKYYSYPPDFPESYIVIPNWYSSTSASAVVTSNAAFKLTKPTINNNGSTFTIKVVCEALNYSSGLYNASDFYNTTIYFVWKNIKEPTDKFPNGYITCELHLYYCDTSGMPQDRSLKTGYIPFASKAEYNAAICLTATELPTFDLSEEKYTLLVPNSLCLLSGELPSTKLAEEGVIYLTPNENNTTFKQYMWNGTEYKYLGETEHKVDAKEIGAATAADITAAVNAISIGGRNLLPNTNDMSQWNVFSADVRINTDSEGYSEGVFYGDNKAWVYLTSKPNIPYSKIRNKQITIGFEYRAEEQWISSVRAFACSLDLKLTDSALNRVKYTNTLLANGNYEAPTTQWHRFSATINVSDSIFVGGSGTCDFDNVFCSLGIYRNNTCHLHFRKFKMEIGNKSTDWTPAPEDAERRITALEVRVAALEAAAVSGGEV